MRVASTDLLLTINMIRCYAFIGRHDHAAMLRTSHCIVDCGLPTLLVANYGHTYLLNRLSTLMCRDRNADPFIVGLVVAREVHHKRWAQFVDFIVRTDHITRR